MSSCGTTLHIASATGDPLEEGPPILCNLLLFAMGTFVTGQEDGLDSAVTFP
jgi:hypothetical protein